MERSRTVHKLTFFSARIIVCLCPHHPTSDEQVMCHGHCSQRYSTLSTVPLVNDTNGTDTGTVVAFLHQWDGSSIYFRNLYCSRKINTFRIALYDEGLLKRTQTKVTSCYLSIWTAEVKVIHSLKSCKIHIYEHNISSRQMLRTCQSSSSPPAHFHIFNYFLLPELRCSTY